MKLHWLRARAFVHATEDEERVLDAMLWTIGQLGEEGARSRVHRQRAKGHYGNEIVLLEASLKSRADIERGLDHVLADAAVRSQVRDTLLRRLDEDNVLHLRVDKQAAVQRRMALSEGSDAFVVTAKVVLHGDEIAAPAWSRYLAGGSEAEPPATSPK